MGTSYGDLLNQLIAIRNGEYRSDPDRQQAMMEQLDFCMQTVLEKLADHFDADRRSVGAVMD